MLLLVAVALVSTSSAEKRVYEIIGTTGDFAGLYVETEVPRIFQQLGGPTEDGYFLFLYHLNWKPKEWRIGDRKKEIKGQRITPAYKAVSKTDYEPPSEGWTGVRTGREKEFRVVKRPNLASTLEQTEEVGGSLASDGGVICVEQGTNKWIMLAKNDPKMCNQERDCEGGFDEHKNCPSPLPISPIPPIQPLPTSTQKTSQPTDPTKEQEKTTEETLSTEEEMENNTTTSDATADLTEKERISINDGDNNGVSEGTKILSIFL